MRKMKMMILCALLAVAGSATAQTVKMTATDVEIDAGGTADVSVSLETAMTIAGWQMYLYLPEGITVAYDEEDGERFYDDTVVLSSRHKHGHTCTVTETADGGWLIMGYNPSKPTELKETSGEIVTITLQASDNYKGNHTGIIKDVAVSTMDNTQTDMEGEVTFTIEGPVPTGIHPSQVSGNDEPVYNLGGQRVKKPVKKGIYVRSGKKEVKR